jgi:3-oxoadipate enol-lactonase
MLDYRKGAPASPGSGAGRGAGRPAERESIHWLDAPREALRPLALLRAPSRPGSGPEAPAPRARDGHGRSLCGLAAVPGAAIRGASFDPGRPFTTRDLGADLIELLDALELRQVDAAGYFLGGMAIQEAALQAPERFRQLVLVGTWARPDAKRHMLLEAWAALARANTQASAMIRHRLIWTLSDSALEERELVATAVAHLDDGITPVTGEAFARQCDACAGHDTLARLARLAHPTLALCGRKDLLTPSKFSREIAEAMPNARDVALAYSGHAVMAERPERFNQVVLNFLDPHEEARMQEAGRIHAVHRPAD